MKYETYREHLNDLQITIANLREKIKELEAERGIIHCKDCKHYTYGQRGKPYDSTVRNCNRSCTVKMNPEDFCSKAERRSE